MDSWAFRANIVGFVRKWLKYRTDNWESYFFYPGDNSVPVDVSPGKRVRVTFEVEEDPDYKPRLKAWHEARAGAPR